MFKRSKYGAKKHTLVIDGQEEKFDSKLESDRYLVLLAREFNGDISALSRQPKFTLQEKFRAGKKAIRAIHYIADFIYTEDGEQVVEDAKGWRTTDYKLKMKMFLNTHKQYKFVEVEKKRKEFIEVVYDRRDSD
tara:strand:+ start:5558 stop:5959 length:402 start_codon:yes stop_codon:yes gene_type:complete